MTPAESEEGDDEEAYLDHTPTPRDIPDIITQSFASEQVSEDLDMLDSLPLHSPAGPGLVSPFAISNRVPTPRYGSFFLRPTMHHAARDVVMDGVEDGIVRAMGLSSLNRVIENRILPSPITECERWGMGMATPNLVPGSDDATAQGRARYDDDDDDDDTAMGMLTPYKTVNVQGPPSMPRKSRGSQSGGMGKPMLVMGYRADCNKCRARVPGHYSHILRS